MEEENKQNYIFTWTGNERNRYNPVINAIKSGSRSEVEKAAHSLTTDIYGIPQDDVDLLPSLPGWITNDVLLGNDDVEHDFENTIIILIPPKNIAKEKPEAEIFKDTKLSDKPVWFKIKYDEQGVTNKGLELRSWYKGVPPEGQDAPDDLGLN